MKKKQQAFQGKQTATYVHHLRMKCKDGTEFEALHSSCNEELSLEEAAAITQGWSEHYKKDVSSVFVETTTVENADNMQSTQTTSGTNYPPQLAEFIGALFVQKRYKNALIGDLAADYESDLEKFGKARADRLYWAAVLRSTWPIVRRWGARTFWLGLGSTIGKLLGS